MKKLLIPILLFSFSVANAQTKSKATKNKETQAYAKISKDKRAKMDEMRAQTMEADSMRVADDSLNEAYFDSTRMAWVAGKEHEIDSSNTSLYSQMAQDKEMTSMYEHNEAMINKSAKLSVNETYKLKVINSTYRDKATAINSNIELDAAAKSSQLSALNTERTAKIKAALGKSDYRKYNKAEQRFMKKNPGKTENISGSNM